MKKFFTILLLALVVTTTTSAQQFTNPQTPTDKGTKELTTEHFKPRFSVGGAAFFGGAISFLVGTPPGPWYGVSGFASFDAQLSKHSGLEFNIGGSIGKYYRDKLVTSISYKFFSRKVNFNVGASFYADLKKESDPSDHSIAPFVRVSGALTLYKSLYCEPFFEFSVPLAINYGWHATLLPSVGFALKYRF